ncbi:MAG TPA: amidohydrolase, partial [Thermoanaerobaculia bacterium]|nr:amidohydrolase [Thermoanaerobaculia bacterium]
MSKRAEAPNQSLFGAGPAALAAGFALLLSAGSGAPLAAYPQVPGQAPGHPVLLQRGDLYTVSHGVLPATDLVIDGGKIVAIGKGLPVPAGAEVIDVSGKRVYPGLIAAVNSLGLVEIDAVRATRDQNERWPVAPEVLASTAYNPDSELIPVTRAGGVTTAQVMPVGGLIRGRSFVVHLDGWTREDAALKPLDGLVMAWPPPLIEARPSVPGSEDLRKESEEARETLRVAFTDARSYALARKADPSLPVEARWEAMRPLFERKMPLYVLADDVRQIREALAFGREQGLSLVILGGLESDLVADQLVADGVP